MTQASAGAGRETGPLAGRSIVVTRPRSQASALSDALTREGARVIEAAVVRTEALDFDLPEDLSAFDLIVFSSPNGVEYFLAELGSAGRDARALAGPRIAVIGPGTDAALARHNIVADLVPDRAIGESLAELVAAAGSSAALVVRARGGRDVVVDALRDSGGKVELIEPYVTVPETLDAQQLERVLSADWATLTSASSARALCDAVGGADVWNASAVKLASIGPITTAALAERGLRADLEATEHTPAGLVAALVARGSG